MNKRVTFGVKPALTPDDWVKDKEPTKRLTMDIPQSLHGRFKADCALKGESMVDVILRLLNEKYPG